VKLFEPALSNRKTLVAALARAAPEPTPDQFAVAAIWVADAREHATGAAGARRVLVCNMLKLRLHAFGQGTARYAKFDLARIDNPQDLKLLPDDRLKLAIDHDDPFQPRPNRDN